MYDITASIVTFNNQLSILKKTIDSFLDTDLHVKLYISDNSSTKAVASLCHDSRIEYRYNDQNLGYGKGHNKIMKEVLDITEFHLVLNPDVYFSRTVIPHLLFYLKKNSDVGLISPKILYPDHTLQSSCRLIPNALDMVIRRIPFLKMIFNKRITNSELLFTGYDKEMAVPFILGAFQLFRTEALKTVGLFDEQFFMYMEDLDISRRVNDYYKVVFYPYTHIYHFYERGSAKHQHLLRLHLRSMIKYFRKWGWINDRNRRLINKKSLDQFL